MSTFRSQVGERWLNRSQAAPRPAREVGTAQEKPTMDTVRALPQVADPGSYGTTRFNALRHGVLSRYTVLPWEDYRLRTHGERSPQTASRLRRPRHAATTEAEVDALEDVLADRPADRGRPGAAGCGIHNRSTAAPRPAREVATAQEKPTMDPVRAPPEVVVPGSYGTTRFNALRHGVLSRYTVLPWEDEAEYQSLLAALVAEHAPEGPTEEHLVEELAGIIWRKRRVRIAEASVFRQKLRHKATDYNSPEHIAGAALLPLTGCRRGQGEHPSCHRTACCPDIRCYPWELESAEFSATF